MPQSMCPCALPAPAGRLGREDVESQHLLQDARILQEGACSSPRGGAGGGCLKLHLYFHPHVALGFVHMNPAPMLAAAAGRQQHGLQQRKQASAPPDAPSLAVGFNPPWAARAASQAASVGTRMVLINPGCLNTSTREGCAASSACSAAQQAQRAACADKIRTWRDCRVGLRVLQQGLASGVVTSCSQQFAVVTAARRASQLQTPPACAPTRLLEPRCTQLAQQVPGRDAAGAAAAGDLAEACTAGEAAPGEWCY